MWADVVSRSGGSGAVVALVVTEVALTAVDHPKPLRRAMCNTEC